MKTEDLEYPGVDLDKEIQPDTPGDRAALLLMADLSARDAREAKADPTARRPMAVDAGYSITWETPDGMIGLWSCWMKDRLYLGYPTAWPDLSDDHIRSTFERAVHKPRYRPDYGRSVGEWTVPLGDGQAISLDTGHDSNAHHFHYIDGHQHDQYGPPQAMYGWGVSQPLPALGCNLAGDTGKRLFTEPFWRPEGIEAGTWDKRNPEWDQARDLLYGLEPNFVSLGCALANEHGCTGVTVELGGFGVGIIPEHLEVMGFEVEWLCGAPGTREGFGSELVYGRRGTEEVMLRSANSLVNWVCYRRKPVSGPVSEEFVRELLTF